MTPEEKAKAYDKAIKKAAALYKASEPMSGCNVIIETLFPELKESEDEKIKEDLIQWINEFPDTIWRGHYKKDVIAWLEKQKDCIKLSNSAYTSNRDVIKFADKYSHTVWENLMDKFKKIENYSIGCNDVSDIVLNAIINTYNWLGKQYEQKPVISDDALREGIAHFGITQYQIDNWLKKYIDIEKKGEQESVDEAEPKFHIGDKIRFFRKGTTNEEPMTITKINEKGYWSNDLFICNFIDADRRLELVEQKPIDKAEPKFSIGDWIVSDDKDVHKDYRVCKITKIDDDRYYIEGGYFLSESSLSLYEYRLWTIQDAKNGDILAEEPIDNYPSSFVAIYKERGLDFFNSHCFIGFDGNFYKGEEGHDIENIHPATKEQRDLLFQKMQEAGYEWNNKKKELVNIGKDNIDKPKFSIGDWISNGIDVDKIIGIDLEDENYLFENGRKSDISLVDSNSHQWTIQDAKDGDVLTYVTDEEDLWIMIYWSLYEPYEGHVHYHALLVNDNFSDKGTCCICINDLKPATKEQRDLLFQKMEEAGYELDAKKKELVKIRKDDDKLREAICE